MDIELKDGKASLAANLDGARELFEDVFSFPIIRREHKALSFDAKYRLRVTSGDDGSVTLVAHNINPVELQTRLHRLGFNANLERDEQVLNIELGYFAQVIVEFNHSS